MRTLVVIVFVALLCGIPSAWAQEKETGAITGRVTLDGKPAKDITVIATLSVTDPSKIAESFLNKAASLKATTDSDGNYRFEDLPPGKYRLAPYAPALVSDSNDSAGETTVTGGATTEGMNFSLSAGGVITGKVTDSDGRPVIGEKITLKAVESNPNPAAAVNSVTAMMNTFGAGGRMYATDDRGIYRIYGLRAGRYLVSAGADSDVFSAIFKMRPKRTQTFYPGVSDQARAKQVQVNAGSEVGAIDIQFSAADKGFVVSGRVIEAQKGAGIGKAMVAYSAVRSAPNRTPNKTDDEDSDDDQQQHFGGIPGGITTTNENGEFKFESVAPGSYKLEVEQFGAMTGIGTKEFYGDPITFEVRSGNVDKLEVKLHRGASISGVVVAENADGDTGLQGYGRLVLSASVTDAQTRSYSSGTSVIAEDGTFRIGGLKSGKATFRLDSIGEREAALVRIELNGGEIQSGVDIQANEQLTGVRVIVTRANCVIKGHVTVEGGTLPPGRPITVRAVRAKRLSTDVSGFESTSVDSKGDFVIENLAPDTYEVEASTSVPSKQGMRTFSTKQTVSTATAQPGYVSLVLDLAGKSSDQSSDQ
ncbi:MAG TPA: carboxypeptidase regulatory-like domain-containing protein [Blastocatellia bacterium]|nr:carboxypeptidase regulatory-like domain-containing protein [Blastocatellia bacterium]